MVATEYNSPQTIIDNLHSAVIVIGDNLQIMCINPAAELLFNISNTRASKKNIRDLIINQHEFFDRLERSLISAHPYTVYDDELRLHNHTNIDVDYSVSPIQYLSKGQFLLLEFIRLKTHHQISHEESILSQYEASKSLLRGLAHEIKNPLGGIRGAAQLLERELDDNDTKQFTQIIIQEADRLKNLLDRMVGPKDIPTKTEINIHKALEHVRQLVIAENNQLKISADYDPSIPELHADEAMRNCKIGSRTHSLVAKISIEDNGSGVSKELQEKIFMPMITGHAEGTGLGLSIAQSLAQQHDGLIEFISRPHRTIFTISLPINLHNGHS